MSFQQFLKDIDSNTIQDVKWNKPLTKLERKQLIEAIATKTSIGSVDLSNTGLNDADASQLAAIKTIRTLTVTGNKITSVGASKLIFHGSFTELDLSKNKINIADLATSQKNDGFHINKLTTLNLSGNQCKSKKQSHIADLAKCNNLVMLDLSKVKFGDTGATEVATVISNVCSLNTIKLNECDIGDEGAIQVAQSTQRQIQIELVGNKIEQQGAEHLVEKSKSCNWSVDLSSNLIKDPNSATIAFKLNPQKVALKNNPDKARRKVSFGAASYFKEEPTSCRTETSDATHSTYVLTH